MTMNKRYKVVAKMSTYCYVYVDANSNSEAIEIASEMDGSDFIPMEQGTVGDWEITEAILEFDYR